MAAGGCDENVLPRTVMWVLVILEMVLFVTYVRGCSCVNELKHPEV